MSIVSDAIEQWRECRDAFEDTRVAAYDAAEEACRGKLLNRKAAKAGVDAYSLFMGNRSHAYAHASEELIEWWLTNKRPTYEEFERQWVQRREAEALFG